MSLSLSDARAIAAMGAVSPRAAAFIAAVHAKGAFNSAELLTTVTLAAAARRAGTVVTKRQRLTATTGTSYANQKQNRDRATGPLPHGQTWAIFPWIALSADGNTEYARIYVDSRTAHFDTTYYVDGVEVDGFDDIRQYLTASAIAKHDAPADPDAPVWTLGPKITNVIAVNEIAL